MRAERSSGDGWRDRLRRLRGFGARIHHVDRPARRDGVAFVHAPRTASKACRRMRPRSRCGAVRPALGRARRSVQT